MRARRRQSFEILSVSALDLFASSLGVFMLLSLMLIPYYLKKPAAEGEVTALRAQVASAEASVGEGERRAAEAEAKRQRAVAARARAAERVESAEAAVAAAAASLKQAEAASAEAAAAQQAAAAKAAQAAPRPLPPRQPGVVIDDLDLVFVMDATGSMRDELADVQASLVGIVRVLGRLAASLRVGFVAYKDRGDEFLTRVYPLTPVAGGRTGDLLAFVRSFRASGGGDDPEPIDVALTQALAMPWRAGAQARILVIGDAQVHPANAARTLEMAEAFRRSSPSAQLPRTVSAIYTGPSGTADEAFFRRLAAAGGGDFAVHQGAIMESVLLAVLKDAVPGAGGPT